MKPGLAYRPLDPALDLERILSSRYERVVARDNTAKLEERLIQIPPGPRRRSYFAAHVWVHELLDGASPIAFPKPRRCLAPCLHQIQHP
jgi:hypothetical protein